MTMPASELLYQSAQETCGENLVVFNAQAHQELQALCNLKQCSLLQHFKPEVNALFNMGLKTKEAIDGEFDTALILPSKNKQQSFGWMAEAASHIKPGGQIIMACANKHGAKSYETALKKLTGNIASTSKSKCRIFSARITDELDTALMEAWIADAGARSVESHGLISQPGLFSWDRADAGSTLLLQHLPALSGTGMDLCSGYGLLSVALSKQNPAIERLHIVEADRLALGCAQLNCQTWQSKIQPHWLDAAHEALPASMDWIVCNPPFHSGQQRDVGLGQQIIRQACDSLKSGGQLFLVANRQLPYEAVLRQRLRHCETITESEGYKIIQGQQ